jgi:uncharacterized protein
MMSSEADVTTTSRLSTLDALRGVAVMGILLMNIFSFSMPSTATLNPRAYGANTALDYGVWAFNFVLIDNKMRALFSMLFGASMLLFIASADAAGKDGMALHLRRMAWLFVFGCLHFALVWDGDILTLYACAGCIATLWHWQEPRTLIKICVGLTLAGFLLWGSIFAEIVKVESAAHGPRTTVQQVEAAQQSRSVLGEPEGTNIDEELELFKSSYGAILYDRVSENWTRPFTQFFTYVFETLGLMALGMTLLRNGFLRGDWSRTHIWRLVLWSYGIGLSGMGGLLLWAWSSGFDAITTSAIVLFWSIPFRIPVMLGHAGLIILAVKAAPESRIVARIEAVGKMAFTNYLGTSIIITPIFYGYGLGLYGEVFRWETYAFVLPVWALMLLWSELWLAHFRHGPLEWLWRCLTRWDWVAMRRG